MQRQARPVCAAGAHAGSKPPPPLLAGARAPPPLPAGARWGSCASMRCRRALRPAAAASASACSALFPGDPPAPPTPPKHTTHTHRRLAPPTAHLRQASLSTASARSGASSRSACAGCCCMAATTACSVASLRGGMAVCSAGAGPGRQETRCRMWQQTGWAGPRLNSSCRVLPR